MAAKKITPPANDKELTAEEQRTVGRLIAKFREISTHEFFTIYRYKDDKYLAAEGNERAIGIPKKYFTETRLIPQPNDTRRQNLMIASEDWRHKDRLDRIVYRLALENKWTKGDCFQLSFRLVHPETGKKISIIRSSYLMEFGENGSGPQYQVDFWQRVWYYETDCVFWNVYLKEGEKKRELELKELILGMNFQWLMYDPPVKKLPRALSDDGVGPKSKGFSAAYIEVHRKMTVKSLRKKFVEEGCFKAMLSIYAMGSTLLTDDQISVKVEHRDTRQIQNHRTSLALRINKGERLKTDDRANYKRDMKKFARTFALAMPIEDEAEMTEWLKKKFEDYNLYKEARSKELLALREPVQS